MTCKTVRKMTAMVAVAAWTTAVILQMEVEATPQRNGAMLLLVSLAAAAAVCGAVGYLLSKGSAEKVYELGYESGYHAAELSAYESRLVSKVTELSAYRR